MADSGNEIVTEIRLELDKFRADLEAAKKAGTDTAQASAEKMGKGIEDGLGNVALKLKAQFLALGATILAAFATDKIIEAASEQEDAVNSLNAAMLSAGTYSEQASESFQHFAEKLQTTSKFADEVIERNAAMLVSTSRLRGEGLERATQASLDFAAAMNIDVDTAFRVVGKAAEGNLAALSRYGIFLHSTGDEAKDFARALDQINARFGGAARSQIDTFSGAMAQMKNAFNDVQETLGDFIIRSPLVIGVLHAITEVFKDFNKNLKDAGGGQDVIGNLTKKMLEFGDVVVKVMAPIELMFNVLKLGFNAIKLMIQQILTDFADINAKVTGFLANIGVISKETAAGFQGAADVYNAGLKQMEDATIKASDNLFGFGVTAQFDNIIQKTGDFVNQFGNELLKLPKKVQAPFEIITKQMEQLRATLQQIMLGGIVNIASGSVQRLGAALIQGHSAFADFKNFALNALGDMSIKMGEAMLVQSAAFAAMAALISNPFTAPAAAIAFGLALIALGGVLKAAAASGAQGAAGGSGTASPSGGGVIAGGGYGTPPVADQGQAPTPARGEVGTHVQVIVQGNVFDRRQTGLELADAINEAFGSNGVKYATG